jgi:hypothetical protein
MCYSGSLLMRSVIMSQIIQNKVLDIKVVLLIDYYQFDC